MKKFKIGLNLDADINEMEKFLHDNQQFLHSIYFSLPLGANYYSRKSLAKEYEGNTEKLIIFEKMIKQFDIKTEITFNTNLGQYEINKGIDFILKHDIVPDEIVCLNNNISILKETFHRTKFVSSFCNGVQNILPAYDSVVLGQSFLRNIAARHKIYTQGYSIVLLLNNGCSFSCNHNDCNTNICQSLYLESQKIYTVNEIYALQSFFPEELTMLEKMDKYSREYIYKISNRPLGLKYTKKVLNAYANQINSKQFELDKNREDYALFGALHELCKRIQEYEYNKIIDAKRVFNR